MPTNILALDIAGNPFDWIPPQEAVLYYAMGKVAWELGERELLFRGGFSRSGVQSRILVKPIIAVAGSEIMARMLRKELPLGHRNHLLFKRDRYTCAYCGDCLTHRELSRDHILPQSRGGRDTWMNCVTACLRCNQDKGDKLVHHFRPLLYVPYVPCRAEHYLLSGRNVLADQHDYLSARLPKHSRLL
ncbi:MAG: nuclease [Burkholderiales bacterium RIFCSPLOWO2_02_FULL_57_36]|nr:MAG: nuclease [Burkholderiales bacterium RIFCSPLOWO2_02_FULL_57_36]